MLCKKVLGNYMLHDTQTLKTAFCVYVYIITGRNVELASSQMLLREF